MTIARIIQIDLVHQILVEIVEIEDQLPDTCLMFSSGIDGHIVRIAMAYPDEDTRNRIFDMDKHEFWVQVFYQLIDEYHLMMGYDAG